MGIPFSKENLKTCSMVIPESSKNLCFWVEVFCGSGMSGNPDKFLHPRQNKVPAGRVFNKNCLRLEEEKVLLVIKPSLILFEKFIS
jgi:hypothetical protein